MVNRIIFSIILLCFFSCKKKIKKEEIFFPNINISIADLKNYEKTEHAGLSYKKRNKDTLITYGFCKYLKTTCFESWEVFFAKKDSLKVFSLLEKKTIRVFNPYSIRWLTEIKYDTSYQLKNINRNLLYKCHFENYGDSSSIILTHKITLYDEKIDWKANYHPSYYNEDLFDEISEDNINEK